MKTNWRDKVASAALLVVLFALALRLADSLLVPLFPALVMVGALAAVLLFVVRGRR